MFKMADISSLRYKFKNFRFSILESYVNSRTQYCSTLPKINLSKSNFFVLNSKRFCTKPKIEFDEYCNTSEKIKSKIGLNLYMNKDHPLGILSDSIKEFFVSDSFTKSKNSKVDAESKFKIFDSLSPIVNVKDCFKDLLVEDTHETMSPKNTYFINKDHVLRTHMTTHDVSLLKSNNQAFISIGDVYRRDTIDQTHYPVFHQVDGVRVYKNLNNKDYVFSELKFCLEQLIK